MAQKNTATALSANAKAIVDTYINQNIFEPHRANALVLELYSRREGADKNIITLASRGLIPCTLTLSEEDFAVLEAEYREVVKYCHSFIVGLEKSQLNAESIHFPSELVELCSQLIESTKDETIFLPYAGYCDMAFALESKSVSGFDFNLSTVAFNKILFDAYGISGGISSGDSLAPKFEGNEHYDHIISFPPRLTSKENREIAQYTLDLLQRGLTEGGDMCLILPLEDMTTGTWYAFRNYLVKNKHSYQVLSMSLPAIFQPKTAIKFCILFIEKTDNPEGLFYFMESDREEFYFSSKDNHHQLTLKVNSILDTIQVCDNRYLHGCDLEKDNRAGNSPSFAPSRYFAYDNLPELNEGFQYFHLKELVGDLVNYDLIQVVNEEIDFMGPRPAKYIKISSLYDNYLSCTIDYDKIYETLPPNNIYEGYASGGYVAYLNGKMKVGQVLNNSKTVPFDSKIAHFAIKSDERVRMDYLLRELTSDYVLEQAKHFSFGTARQEMRSSDLYKLMIAVPSLELQDEILKQDRIAAIGKAEAKLEEINEKFRKDVHMMKHGIGQTVFNLGNWIKMLNYARKVGNGIVSDSSEIGGLVKVKVADIYDNIEASLRVLSRQITTFDIGSGMQTTEFSLTDFINKYIEEHKRPNVRFDFTSQQQEEDANDFIDFSEKALDIIFENIVSNAVAHGFTETDKAYVIRFDIVPEGTNYVLYISNNGAPLASDKVASEIFVWGKTNGGKAHAGIGGYQVKDLMEHFDGKAEIISNPEEEFTVTYKLTFTKTDLLNINL